MRWIGAILVATALVGFVALFAAGSVLPAVMQCDGSVPRWMLPPDYDNSGCVDLRPQWEASLPWNQGKAELVCLGMCVDAQPGQPIAPR
jgi:hypothetical protein